MFLRNSSSLVRPQYIEIDDRVRALGAIQCLRRVESDTHTLLHTVLIFFAFENTKDWVSHRIGHGDGTILDHLSPSFLAARNLLNAKGPVPWDNEHRDAKITTHVCGCYSILSSYCMHSSLCIPAISISGHCASFTLTNTTISHDAVICSTTLTPGISFYGLPAAAVGKQPPDPSSPNLYESLSESCIHLLGGPRVV
jgi:hypothetical protein